MTGKKTSMVAALAAVVSLAFAAPTMAQTQVQTAPGQTVYTPPGTGEVQGTIGGGGPSDIVPPPSAPSNQGGGATPTTPVERGATPPAPGGDLPFTGFEAGLVALAGLALLGTGFALRRVSRSSAVA
jgi:hypothetical protein